GCLKNADCETGLCVSTGEFCAGGDLADYSCVIDADCNQHSTDGVCRHADTPTPTATPTATPTPPPLTSQFLCSAGPFDGQPCTSDDDCAPGGACVLVQGVCNGGDFDGFLCDCPGGSC